jgi:lipoprotein-releasing system permease protein
VWNINPIHEWLGRAFGLSLWDPKVYYFSEIPRHVEPVKAMIVVIGAVVFSVIGALVPALRAASYDPVKSLRFE